MNWPAVVEYLQSCPPAKAKEQLLRLAWGKCKVKPVRPKVRLPRGTKPKSMKVLKKAAWDAFSKWIRYVRDCDESDGLCRCCTCGGLDFPQNMDAGHFESRVYESVLFDEQNVHAQCKSCNMPPNNGRRIEYAVFLDRKYGPGTAAKISARAKRRRLTRDELEKILTKYQAEGPTKSEQ